MSRFKKTRFRSTLLSIIAVAVVIPAVCIGIYELLDMSLAASLDLRSENYPAIETGLSRYMADHGGALPAPEDFFTALADRYVPKSRLYACGDVSNEQKRFHAAAWNDANGTGLLVYFDNRPFGPVWGRRYCLGLVVYPLTKTARYVKLFKLPSDRSFTQECVKDAGLQMHDLR